MHSWGDKPRYSSPVSERGSHTTSRTRTALTHTHAFTHSRTQTETNTRTGPSHCAAGPALVRRKLVSCPRGAVPLSPARFPGAPAQSNTPDGALIHLPLVQSVPRAHTSSLNTLANLASGRLSSHPPRVGFPSVCRGRVSAKGRGAYHLSAKGGSARHVCGGGSQARDSAGVRPGFVAQRSIKVATIETLRVSTAHNPLRGNAAPCCAPRRDGAESRGLAGSAGVDARCAADGVRAEIWPRAPRL